MYETIYSSAFKARTDADATATATTAAAELMRYVLALDRAWAEGTRGVN